MKEDAEEKMKFCGEGGEKKIDSHWGKKRLERESEHKRRSTDGHTK